MSQLIAVWGPTGAPGRTTVAINLAAELAEQGSRVLLIDADTYGGAIAPLLGLTDDASGLAALCRLAESGSLAEEDIDRVSQLVPTAHGELQVISGIVKTDRWPELSAERMKKVCALATQCCDVVVVDVGFNLETDEEITSDLFAPRRNAATHAVLKDADCIIEVASADALGIARFIRAHDVLVDAFPESLRLIVVNKVRSGFDSRGTTQATTALGRYAGLHDLHELSYDDKAIGASSVLCQPLNQAAKNSKLRKQFLTLAQQVVPGEVSTAVKSNRFARSRKQESVSEQSEQHRDSA
ncbi:AAA family ATPase [Aurantimicrobium minutum]|uniref:AAA family ATPase n=1 Tax=Aurantimicrobium minutum TaxID=708131 RepID=UPI0024754E8D|nr:P-loop NTPase [Aurantimicrobium minutum]MDH6423770.1 MinD-like ATPase involved in chromosome partitioning or flagellar assembly [Aurantimicrobium minutum]